MKELSGRRDLAGGQERKRLHRSTSNESWLSAIPHHFNGMELSMENFRDNICLRYRLMPQDTPATCNSFDDQFSIEHALS